MTPDHPEQIAQDVLTVGRIEAVPALLRVICETTGMGFAAVARVTEGTWTACAVQDNIGFGLQAGGQLDIHTTLCKEVREARALVAIDQASADERYRTHPTPRLYGIESYISVPIVLPGGEYFGNLCAIDPRPARVSEPRILSLFTLFAELIALQLQNERKLALERSAMLDEKAAGELREQFIAILGHDLRNPLSAVLACAQLVARKSADPQIATLAQRITANARRMSGLIDDVLDFARGRLGGGFGVHIEEVGDMEQALAQVAGELRDAHPERDVVSHIGAIGPVWCDRARVQQLVSNLLANALTHGRPGGAAMLEAFTDADALVLRVHNDGDPIPPEHLSSVFSPFWRHATSAARGGLGLGLFICAQIVEAQHGKLAVSSSAEEGTTFEARLPLRPVAAR
jgi:hypothetical protein